LSAVIIGASSGTDEALALNDLKPSAKYSRDNIHGTLLGTGCFHRGKEGPRRFPGRAVNTE
jgi:hypothetical protein